MDKKEEIKELTEEVVEALSQKQEVLSGNLSNDEFIKTIKKNKSTIRKWVNLSVKYKNDTFQKCAEVWNGTVKGFFKDFVKNNKNKMKKAIITGTAVASMVCLSACSVEAGIVNEDGKKGLYFEIGGKEQSSQASTPSASENQNDSQMGDGVYDNTTGGYVHGGDGVWDTNGKGDSTTPSGTTPDYVAPDYTTPDYTTDSATPENPTTPDNWGEGGYVFGGENGNENGEGTYVDSTNPTNPTNPSEPTNPTDPTSPTNPSTNPSAQMNALDDLVSQLAGRTFKVASVSVVLDANNEVKVQDGNYMGVDGKFVTLVCTSSAGDTFRLKVEINDFYLANGGKDPGYVKGDAVGAIYGSVAESAMDRYGMISNMGM